MKNEFRFGRLRYVSFICADLLCLVLSNLLAFDIYLKNAAPNYQLSTYWSVVLIMILTDLFVTFAFNTLNLVMRRRIRVEILQSIKHVALSFVTLAVILFSLRRGAVYSRIAIVLSYTIDLILIIAAHLILREIMKYFRTKSKRKTAILMTTDRFVDEGLEELRKGNIKVKYIYLLKNLNRDSINDIPVTKTWEEAASAICWDLLDNVYIYGLDHQMIPANLVRACKKMKLQLKLVDFNYKIIDVKTIQNEDPKYGALSFLEGKRDIPFPIRRVYWITETEADLHRGFHAHKLNCQLLYCPYGKIDIILDDGIKKTTVTLDQPGKGLILMPGLWREMVWRQSGSVLCVLASEYYDANEYIRNYDEFISYTKQFKVVSDLL